MAEQMEYQIDSLHEEIYALRSKNSTLRDRNDYIERVIIDTQQTLKSLAVNLQAILDKEKL